MNDRTKNCPICGKPPEITSSLKGFAVTHKCRTAYFELNDYFDTAQDASDAWTKFVCVDMGEDEINRLTNQIVGGEEYFV